MNVDDLRTELARRGEQATSLGSPNRLAEVHARIDARRRATVATAVGGTAAAALVAVAATAGVLDGAARHEPIAPATQLPAPTPDPYAFPERVDGNALIASRLNQPGETTLTWRLTLDSLDVAWNQFCDTPTRVRPGDTHLMATWFANGEDMFGTSCGPGNGPGASLIQGVTPRGTRGAWRDAGVRPGEPFTLTMRLTGIKEHPQAAAQARFGIGLYEVIPAD